MTWRRMRRLAALAALALVASLAWSGAAAAEPFGKWSGKKGRFAWEAKRTDCGSAGKSLSPSRVRAHTRWKKSPANGYVRLVFRRQIRDEDTGKWMTVQQQRRSTKNTPLEGVRSVVHWSQWFNPFEDEAGLRSRHLVDFAWLLDRPGADRRVLRRQVVTKPCVVGGP
jgi:hypothetical protein